MDKKLERVILDSSDEAAEFRSDISGWVSRNGLFFGKDERLARYDGCTHRKCSECDNLVEKSSGYMLCAECRRKKENAIYESYEKREWDGKTPLTLFNGDEYFFDKDSLFDYCYDNGTTPENLKLIICDPNYAREIDDDFYCDDLPEDFSLDDVNPDLASLIDAVNNYIREKKPILSWGPSKIAAVIK